MRDVLDRFVRSLAEQELAPDAPERSQDLGTFVCWLLERRGFSVLLRSFRHRGSGSWQVRPPPRTPSRHEGVERQKSSGLTQLGVDIIASRRRKQGRRCLYLFVLKQGNITLAHAGGHRGSLFQDIELASLRPKTVDAWFDLGGTAFDEHAIVAIHNGDLDERLVGFVQEARSRLRERGVRLLWWDAAKLVKYALLPAREAGAARLSKAADASVFPPGVRPFARAALDSLARDDGRSFDLDAVDRLLDAVLPAGRALESEGPGDRLAPGPALAARELRRRLGELALFTMMVEIECRRIAHDLALPTLDSIERVLCRAMEHARRIPDARFAGHRGAIRKLFHGLVDQYIARANALLRRLDPLLDAPYGLALSGPSERIDYPLRALRLSGYLAAAGLALLDRRKPRSARRFAEALDRLWKTNEAACLGPVTDDQIIEIALVLELWRRSGMAARAANAAAALVLRLGSARVLDLPLPALYQHARVPMDEADLQVLSEVHIRGRADAPPAFNDDGSTLLPLAIYLAHRGGAALDPAAVKRFMGPRAVHLQAWRPPEEAAETWYVQEVRRGEVKLFDLSRPLEAMLDAMAEEFEAFHRPLPPSPAEKWGLPILDRLAWKLWRTPPPLAIFCR